MLNSLKFPFDYNLIQRKKKALKKELESKQNNFIEKKIAILGGSTTGEIQNLLELFLLSQGIKPFFYQSEYNRYYEDVVLENPALKSFNPDFIYFHTSSVNISTWPSFGMSESDIEALLNQEIKKLESIWNSVHSNYGCQVIQNNFEFLNERPLGNLDTVSIYGKNNFIRNLNKMFFNIAQKYEHVLINDINFLSAQLGLGHWHDTSAYFSYKNAMSYQGMVELSHCVASIIKTSIGKTKKCLVLDLDNTLWGGIIGDDGVGGIALGSETALGESYMSFQKYVKNLKERGIILAVCSKNDLENAKKGFSHTDSVLAVSDFSAFVANWETKDKNIKDIANALNIGLDSIVFADDNPVEREFVSQQLPEVSVVEFGESIIDLMRNLDRSLFFDTISISKDDLQRHSFYKDNQVRQEFATEFKNYNEYLNSLEMEAEVYGFSDLYIDRIAQLTNKTNQFNLTTMRHTLTEVSQMANSENYISFCMRLKDRFGDNGIVTVLSGEKQDTTLNINLWLMSCRVFKRTLEFSAFQFLINECNAKKIDTIVGIYIPSGKNSIVENLYAELGFELAETKADGSTRWIYKINISKKANEENAITVRDLRNER